MSGVEKCQANKLSKQALAPEILVKVWMESRRVN